MLQRKPEYYDKFTCIANDCSLTCCQEWKIYVDDDTLNKWKILSLPEAPEKTLDCYVNSADEQSVITLNQKHKCPFLNQQKLCKLVIAQGDEVLSKTCQTFPRQIHSFPNVTEYSLVACCPAVVDYFYQDEPISFINEEISPQTSLFFLRHQMMKLVWNRDFSLSKNLSMLFYLLLEIYHQGDLTTEALCDFTHNGALHDLSDAINQIPVPQKDSIAECNELFLDLAENYRKEGLYVSYLEPIAKLAEEISVNYEDTALLDLYKQFDLALASYETLLRNYMAAELFTSVLLPDSDLEHMVVAFQWIGMEYAVLRQALFLRWYLDGKSLSYKTLRSYLCVIARMTGYDEADYYEYLENSFESLIWDWGYFALIIH